MPASIPRFRDILTPKRLSAHAGSPPETAFVFVQFKRTDLNYSPGPPPCQGRSTHRDSVSSSTKRTRGRLEDPTEVQSSARGRPAINGRAYRRGGGRAACALAGPAHEPSQRGAVQWRGPRSGRRTGSRWVSGVGCRRQASDFSMWSGTGRLASREGGKVRGGVSERNVADSRDKRSCPRLGFDFVFPFLFLFLF